MKRFILAGSIVISLLLSSKVIGQSFAEVEKPSDSPKWSIETLLNTGQTGVNWSMPALRARYFINENWAVRLQLGIGDGSGKAMNEKYYFFENSDGTGDVGTHIIKRSALNLQLGGEYHLIGTKKLSPYLAFAANVGLGSQAQNLTKYDNTAYNPYVNIEGKGGYYTAGGTVGIGIDFYFIENVYIGLELGVVGTYLSYKDAKREVTLNLPNEPEPSIITQVLEPKYNKSFLGTRTSFRIGWRF